MTSGTGITFEAIRERAHEIWDRNHRPDGFDIEFWLLAERELKTEKARGAADVTDGAETGADEG